MSESLRGLGHPFNQIQVMTETEKLFEKYAEEGEKMEAFKALKMLTKAYIRAIECGMSIEMKTAVYSAAEVWLFDRLPKEDENPFTEEEINGTLAALMPRICNRYKDKFYGYCDICGGLSPEKIKMQCWLAIDEKRFGSETLTAFCWATKQIPDLYLEWETKEIHHVAFIRPFIHGCLNPRIAF